MKSCCKGRGVIEASGDSDRFRSFFTFAGTSSDTQVGQGEVDMRTEIDGTFLKADCGDAGRPRMPGLTPGFELPTPR